MEISKLLQIKQEQVIQYRRLINDFNAEEKQKIILNSGSINFDKVLKGGFSSGKVYLVFGANRTGKTQVSHQLCVQAFKHSLEENNSFNIMLLDTENTFRPERIKQLCEARHLDFNNTLKKIMVSSIMSSSTLLLSLDKVEEELKNKSGGILIIDSINNYYRVEQADSFNSAKITFLQILNKINELTQKFNLITIVLAQVSPNFGESAIIRDLPVGSIFLNHFFSEVLYLNINEEDQYFVHLLNSHSLPEKKLLYKITSSGIEDNKL